MVIIERKTVEIMETMKMYIDHRDTLGERTECRIPEDIVHTQEFLGRKQCYS